MQSAVRGPLQLYAPPQSGSYPLILRTKFTMTAASKKKQSMVGPKRSS